VTVRSSLVRSGACKHLWNVCKLLPDYMAQHPRRQSYSSVSILDISHIYFRLRVTVRSNLVRSGAYKHLWNVGKLLPDYTAQHPWRQSSSRFIPMKLSLQNKVLLNTVESRLSDLRLSDIPFYPTCRVGTLHFINSRSEGLNSIETALAYVEQQREATATDVLLFRSWRDLAAKKRKEAQKQIPNTNFLKKINSFL
jgi:hypothetical protein